MQGCGPGWWWQVWAGAASGGALGETAGAERARWRAAAATACRCPWPAPRPGTLTSPGALPPSRLAAERRCPGTSIARPARTASTAALLAPSTHARTHVAAGRRVSAPPWRPPALPASPPACACPAGLPASPHLPGPLRMAGRAPPRPQGPPSPPRPRRYRPLPRAGALKMGRPRRIWPGSRAPRPSSCASSFPCDKMRTQALSKGRCRPPSSTAAPRPRGEHTRRAPLPPTTHPPGSHSNPHAQGISTDWIPSKRSPSPPGASRRPAAAPCDAQPRQRSTTKQARAGAGRVT